MVCMGGSHHLIVRIPWIPMRFHPFPITDGNAGRVGGKQENASQVKKRLPTLSSTVKLLPLSYLTQSINGQVSEWSNEHAWKVCVYWQQYRGFESSCPPFYSFRNLAKSLILQGFFIS